MSGMDKDIYGAGEALDNPKAAGSDALSEIRRQINDIDAQLAPLLARRMDCSARVAKVKSAEGIPVLDASREETVIGLAAERGKPYGPYVSSVYRSLMGVSRELQRDVLHRPSPLARRILEAASGQPTDQAGAAITGTVACYGTDGGDGSLRFDSAVPAFYHGRGQHGHPPEPAGLPRYRAFGYPHGLLPPPGPGPVGRLSQGPRVRGGVLFQHGGGGQNGS